MRFQTMRLMLPVSSSSVTKVTPLAVAGFWRVTTSPATRTRAPSGNPASIPAVTIGGMPARPGGQCGRSSASG